MKGKLPETVKLIDSNDNVLFEMKHPLTDAEDWPRTLAWMGRLFKEGGGPNQFYKVGELYEVPVCE